MCRRISMCKVDEGDRSIYNLELIIYLIIIIIIYNVLNSRILTILFFLLFTNKIISFFIHPYF